MRISYTYKYVFNYLHLKITLTKKYQIGLPGISKITTCNYLFIDYQDLPIYIEKMSSSNFKEQLVFIKLLVITK